MQISRRRLGKFVLYTSATGTASLCGIEFAGPAFAVDIPAYPCLARLAGLYRDTAGCRRIAATLSPAVVAELTESRLARAEQNAARAWKEAPGHPARVLEVLLANDFRSRRTVEAGGFLLAETEAILVLMHGSGGEVLR